MAMKRTTVFADEDDLAVLKTAAARRGVAEAELLREAIHLAAMANRTWTDPFFTKTFPPEARSSQPPADQVLDTMWAEKAESYERTKSPKR